jgi:hypothetical protein
MIRWRAGAGPNRDTHARQGGFVRGAGSQKTAASRLLDRGLKPEAGTRSWAAPASMMHVVCLTLPAVVDESLRDGSCRSLARATHSMTGGHGPAPGVLDEARSAGSGRIGDGSERFGRARPDRFRGPSMAGGRPPHAASLRPAEARDGRDRVGQAAGQRAPAGRDVARTSSSAKREITASISRATRYPRPTRAPLRCPPFIPRRRLEDNRAQALLRLASHTASPRCQHPRRRPPPSSPNSAADPCIIQMLPRSALPFQRP